MGVSLELFIAMFLKTEQYVASHAVNLVNSGDRK